MQYNTIIYILQIQANSKKPNNNIKATVNREKSTSTNIGRPTRLGLIANLKRLTMITIFYQMEDDNE